MKKIEAIIKPFKLDDVKDALGDIGITSFTISEVKGFGKQRDTSQLYQGANYVIDLLPKIKLEILCEDDVSDEIVQTIQESADTGRSGDGVIFVLPCESMIKIGEQT